MTGSASNNRPNSRTVLRAPAKINLFLAITGARSDGFHNLVSLAALCDFGDDLQREDSPGSEGSDVLEIEGLPCEADSSNLVRRAAEAYRKPCVALPPQRFVLQKRVPLGAGLGGGSSDAAATLKLLLKRAPGGGASIASMAPSLGSDVPFFLEGCPAVMRGRGEILEPVPEAVAQRLRGRSILLFKPFVGMETVRAYGLLKATGNYTDGSWAEERIGAFLSRELELEELLFNTFEEVVADRLPTLAVVLKTLRSAGIPALMSGSGSACFALPGTVKDEAQVRRIVADAWGEGAFMVATKLI